MKHYLIDFSPILKIKLNIPENKKYFYSYFKKEYGNSIKKTNDQDTNYDLIVYIDEKIPDDAIKISKTVASIFPLKFGWKFTKENKIALYYQCNHFKYHFKKYLAINLHTNIMEPLYYYIGLQKDYILFHAASGEYNNHGFVITAHSNCGKTSTILRLAQNDSFSFIGDDLVWVNKTGKIQRYPRQLHLFSHVTKHNKFLPINLKIKILLQIANLIRFSAKIILKRNFHIATRIKIEDLLPKVKIKQSSQLKWLLLLIKNTTSDSLIKITNNDNNFLKEIINTIEPSKNLKELHFANRNNLIDTVTKKEQEIISNIISNSESYIITRNLIFNNADYLKNNIFKN